MKRYPLIAAASFVAFFLLTACTSRPDEGASIKVNQALSHIESFEVSTDLLDANTMASGDVFVQEDPDAADQILITLLATVIIGEEDWGGVSFHIPQGWQLTKALSSYPAGASPGKDLSADIWQTADETSPWKSRLEIGNEKDQKASGGRGSVLIQLRPEEKASLSEGLSILVSVGSKIKDGLFVLGTDSATIQVDASHLSLAVAP